MLANVTLKLDICKKAVVFGAFLFLGISAGGHLSYAIEMPVGSLQSSHARSQTVDALKAINKGRWSEGRNIIAKSKDPLASKIYYWLEFSSERGNHKYARLAQFIRNNPEWPGIRSLRQLVEDKMPEDLRPVEVTSWFDDYKPQTARGMDRYLQALILQGKLDQARGVLSDWWAKALLERKQQKDIYRKYKTFIDQEANQRRFDTLLFAGQYSNARGMAGVLGKGYTELVEARIALAEEKGNVNGYINRVPAHLQNDPGLVYERLRWRRRHDLNARAVEILNNPPSSEKNYNKSAWWRERHIIARRLIEERKHKGAYILVSQHQQEKGFAFAQAEFLAGWLALRFLDDAQSSFQHFETLYHNVTTPMSKSRAAYWAGRAMQEMGAQANAEIWFKDAAKYQTVFYGQMAGAELGMDEALPNAAPPKLEKTDLDDFEKRELVQASRLFHEAGMRDEASDFIQAFVRHENTPKAYRYGAELAADLEHYHDGVRIAKTATKKGMFLTAQSYPVIKERLRKVNLEWALVHALIRQESMFDYKAKSRAGALGLMQLMPATAHGVAKKIGLKHRTSWLTSNPDHNILLGSRYLADMLERFGGSYPLAIAAYNAGPSRVDKWLEDFGDPRLGEVDLIDWIELVPIYETRNYVQRVMESIYIYRLRLKGVQKGHQTPIHIAMSYKP